MPDKTKKLKFYVVFLRPEQQMAAPIISRLKLLGDVHSFYDDQRLCLALADTPAVDRPKVIVFLGEGTERKQHLGFASTVLDNGISKVVFIYRNQVPWITDLDKVFVREGLLSFVPDLDAVTGTPLSERVYAEVCILLKLNSSTRH